MNHSAMQSFPSLLQKFFTQRLRQQRHASPCTVAAYRDCFRLLLAYASCRLHRRPSDIAMGDLDAALILGFLDHLERDRHNCIRTRNARFAAIRSFMEYVSFEEPSALALTRAVLAIPMKRFEQPLVGFLSKEQMDAILTAPDVSTWVGWRDHVMLATLYNTGARVSELLGMRVANVVFGPTSWIHIHGKGRKERSVPLWHETANELKRWLRHYSGAPDAPLFPGRTGDPLTRVGFTERLKLATLGASRQFPELAKRRIFPHMVGSPFTRHAHVAGWRRHHSHLPLARTREPRYHPPLRRSGSSNEGKGIEGASSSVTRATAISSTRRYHSVSTGAVIMGGLS